MNNTVKERISIEVIKTLFSRFNNFPADSSHNRNAPFHEAFLKAFSDKFAGKVSSTPFLISLSSWLHGLNTTLGQSFFENVAHILCGGKKLEYTSKKTGNLKITKQQQDRITQIMTSLSNSSKTPDLEYENGLIFVKDNTPVRTAPDFSADVFRENEKEIIAVEIKTVKPNSGGLLGEIISIINTIATPDFLQKYQFLNNNSKRFTPEYLAQLLDWNIYFEYILIKNNDLIIKKLDKDTEKYHTNVAIFDNEGNYNWWRFSVLEKTIAGVSG
jgi:hypothetical protein